VANECTHPVLREVTWTDLSGAERSLPGRKKYICASDEWPECHFTFLALPTIDPLLDLVDQWHVHMPQGLLSRRRAADLVQEAMSSE